MKEGSNREFSWPENSWENPYVIYQHICGTQNSVMQLIFSSMINDPVTWLIHERRIGYKRQHSCIKSSLKNLCMILRPPTYTKMWKISFHHAINRECYANLHPLCWINRMSYAVFTGFEENRMNREQFGNTSTTHWQSTFSSLWLAVILFAWRTCTMSRKLNVSSTRQVKLSAQVENKGITS